jgi:hypothetical protein
MERAARIAQIALENAPCSPFDQDLARYLSLFSRPGESPAARAYYLQPGLSTCALTVLAVLRLAGCLEPEVVDPYYPGRIGKAFTDVQVLAGRFGAWQAALPSPLLAGDVWVITAMGGSDGHMGLAVTDQGPDGSVGTVEGGQLSGTHGGSSAVGAFTRHVVRSPGGVWMMGARKVFGVARGYLLPVPDDAAIS